MTGAHTFQRARKPEERTVRRAAILDAAAALFDAEGPNGTTLNDIAARAGFTKSNVYRYFESREEVLLTLFLEAFAALADDFVAEAGKVPTGDLAALAGLTASCFARQPRLGRLLAILSTVLEENVSEERIIGLKRAMNGHIGRIAAAFHARLPNTTLEDCVWVSSVAGAIVAGMWPSAHPNAIAARVLAMPEFVHLKPSIERDLERATLALLRSIVP